MRDSEKEKETQREVREKRDKEGCWEKKRSEREMNFVEKKREKRERKWEIK